VENIEWRDIEGYEGIYQVSNMGRVRRILSDGTTKVLNVHLNNVGYPRLILRKDGKDRNYLTHRLVAMAFVDNPDPTTKIQVNHKNGVKTDNRAANLEWCTNSENGKHSFKFLGRKPPNPKLTFEVAQEIRQLLKTTNLTQTAIAHMFNVSAATVTHIKKNQTWSERV